MRKLTVDDSNIFVRCPWCREHQEMPRLALLTFCENCKKQFSQTQGVAALDALTEDEMVETPAGKAGPGQIKVIKGDGWVHIAFEFKCQGFSLRGEQAIEFCTAILRHAEALHAEATGEDPWLVRVEGDQVLVNSMRALYDPGQARQVAQALVEAADEIQPRT